jgi:hypothetical protein
MSKPKTVRGLVIEPPRPTRWAFMLALAYVGLPLIGFLFLLDAILYLFFRYGLDRCYGVLCLFQ